MKYSYDILLNMHPVEVYKLRLSGAIDKFPTGFFREDVFINYEACALITRYFIEEVLKYDDKEICRKISFLTFRKYGLGGMISKIFNGSVYAVIENAYPGRFKPWEFKYTPTNFWDEKTAREAIIWLFEEKLKVDEEDIPKRFSEKLLEKNGLSGMLTRVFNDKVYDALNNAYPGRYKPWEMQCVPKNYWNFETGKEATIWLIEKKLKWSDEEIRENLQVKTFKENGLGNMLISVFNVSPYKALEAAYPGRFKNWELSRVPQMFWDEDTIREAIIWLLEDKLKWTDEEICQNISSKVFAEYGLESMLAKKLDKSILKALNHAYPGKYKKEGKKIMLC